MQPNDKIEDFAKIFYSMNGLVAVTDEDHRFVAFSAPVRKLFGFSSMDEMLGKGNHEIKAGAALYAAEYDQQNQEVLTSQSSRKYFGINGPYSSGECVLLLYEKTSMSLQDKHFVFAHAFDVTNENFAHKWSEILKNDNYYQTKRLRNYLIDHYENHFLLTEREKEVLFYTLRGRTAKECALQLNISTKTAEFHLMHIKQKFGVYNRSSLIEKALDLGYLYRIPASLIAA